MIQIAAAFFLCSSAAAAPAVQASTAASAGAPAPPIGMSTHTVSTLYTGDRVRDPFLPSAMGGVARSPEEKTAAPGTIDIHALTLRGVMQDEKSDFAVFTTDTGLTLLLRGGRLYDDRHKPIPGITGRIRIKQKRAELMTAEKDVQIYNLGETEEDKSGRSP